MPVRMQRRIRWAWVALGALLLNMALPLRPQAAQANDIRAQLEQAQRDLEAVRRKQKEVQNELADLAFQAEEAEAQLRLVEAELVQANANLAIVAAEYEEVSAELELVQAEVALAQARYAEKRKILGDRIRAMRENGPVDKLSVLFGAATFREFISRAEILATIARKDRELVEQMKAEKLALEEKQRQVEGRKTRLAALKAEAEEYQATVVAKREEREQVSRSLEDRRQALAAQLDEMERYGQQLAEQVAALVRELNRQAGVFAPIPPVTPVIITDHFGMRWHPILGTQRMHYGTDFAANYGQTVRAIEAGVVLQTSYDDVYGNLVIIDHGGGITSWYAHNSRILVSPGQAVSQGEAIALAGSTGWSTGPHVHLEIHVDGVQKNPLDYINW
ncbi:cell wall-binding protein [Symbiobacterium thermophilum IAM 14863]|uniref:Cell wall-binding protein n=3 Tax=Symbiobacterium thermophilum TaxID=2734 RepID=Q67T67_SYMTH|nr:cell wall-binding protein [Symbiobacterium thermophilum IAM 14863]